LSWTSRLLSPRKTQPKEKLTDAVEGEEEEEYEDDDGEEEQEEAAPQEDLQATKEILFVPEWSDEDILEQPLNLRRDAPTAYDATVPDSPDLKLYPLLTAATTPP